MADDAIEPLPARCPRCGYDLAGLKEEVALCPECGEHLRNKRPFSRDGAVHFGWILAAAVVPLVVMMAWIAVTNVEGIAGIARACRSAIRRLPLLFFLLLVPAHLLFVAVAAELGSTNHHRSRPAIALVFAVPLDLVATYLFIVVYSL